MKNAQDFDEVINEIIVAVLRDGKQVFYEIHDDVASSIYYVNGARVMLSGPEDDLEFSELCVEISPDEMLMVSGDGSLSLSTNNGISAILDDHTANHVLSAMQRAKNNITDQKVR